MKRVLSSILVTTGVVFGGMAYAADTGAPAPDAAKGEQLFANGDSARGVLACASCHGAAGNSTIPVNPNLSAQPHEYIVKQLLDRSEEHTSELQSLMRISYAVFCLKKKKKNKQKHHHHTKHVKTNTN